MSDIEVPQFGGDGPPLPEGYYAFIRAQDVKTAVDAMNLAASLVPRFVGAWDSETVFEAWRLVRHNGSVYLSLVESEDVEPGTDEEAWELFVSAGVGIVGELDTNNLPANPVDFEMRVHLTNRIVTYFDPDAMLWRYVDGELVPGQP